MWCLIGPVAMLLIVVAVMVRPSRNLAAIAEGSRSAGEVVGAKGGRP
jgi:hypothetical protein